MQVSRQRIKILVPILAMVLYPLCIFAETIVLKSGQKIKGKILKKTDKYINMEIASANLTYFYDDIESIDGERIIQSSAKPEVNTTYKTATGGQSNVISATQLLYQGEFDQAIGKFEKILETEPLNIGAHHNLACAHALKGNYEQALKEFTKALELDNSSFRAVILFDRAVTYFKKGMYEKSENDQSEAVKIIPGMGKQEFFFNLATLSESIWQQGAKWGKMTFSYDETSPELPDTVYFNPNAQNLAGIQRYVFDNYNPPPLFFYRSRFAHVFLGSSYLKQENYPEAEAQFKAALNIQEQYGTLDDLPIALANFYLAQVKLLENDYSYALDYAKKSVEAMPRSSNSYKVLATAYFLSGNYNDARVSCQTALNFKPDDEEAKEMLNKINGAIKSQP